MVRKVFSAVYSEIKGLHEAAYVLALFTLGSQLLALIRDRLLAHQFGAGIELDIYYAAFRIPDLLFVVFASVLSIYVLIPFVTERLGRSGKEGARELLSSVFTAFLVTYGIAAVLLCIFADSVTGFLFPGFTDADHHLLTLIFRILLLQPLLLSISNLFGVVTQLSKRFVLYALSPLLYNVGIIVGIVSLYPIFGLSGIAYGVVMGALAHLLIQVPHVLKSGLAPRIVRSFERKSLKEVFGASIPRALTLSLHQVVLAAFAGIASVMASGSVSVFQFAFNLQSVPLAIIGVSYSVAAFPTLAWMYSNGEREAFVGHVATALRHIFFWSVPAIGLLVVIRAQVVRVILGTGAFNWDDTRLTAAALAIFAISLAAQSVNLLIVRAFYAGGDSRTPLRVTVASSIGALVLGAAFFAYFSSNPSFQVTFESLFRVRGIRGTEILMLPFGYSVALIVHSTVLLIIFMRRFGLKFSLFLGALVRALAAALVGGVTAYAALNVLVVGIRSETFVGILLQGLLAGIAGIISIILTLYLIRSPELGEVWRSLHARIRRTDITAPQPTDDATSS